MLTLSILFVCFWLLVNDASCDGSDWISVRYIVLEARQPGSSSDSTTSAALDSIIRGADQLVVKGLWSITNDKSILPPNKNAHDYLSWAPYHWPDCHWCTTNAKAQGAADVSGNQTTTNRDSTGFRTSTQSASSIGASMLAEYSFNRAARRRMLKVHSRYRHKRQETTAAIRDTIGATAESKPPAVVSILIKTVAPVVTESVASEASTNTGRLSATRSASRAPVGGVAKPTKTVGCTPSPTTSMAPSATWTTCPYVGRDGKVNSDVRKLKGPEAINSMAQYVLFGSIAFAAKKDAQYSQGVVNAIEVFFLNPDTKMNPNVNFGQVVRGTGPNGKKGTFTGVLDVRGIVKVINGILILKSGGSSEWTNAKDQDMRNWLLDYIQWLEGSEIGAVTSTRPNNHVTFYVAQLAASKLYAGDKPGAINVLQSFFKNQFRDQIAASGEQPFEGIRTRPLHYRCFNLEALIMNAKLGDFLGVDFWSVKSKYGATIQTALDYAMIRDPKGEEVDDLIPHVAAVAAAYGDPKGKYKAFLDKHSTNYATRPFWFYDQRAALTKAPTSGKPTARSVIWARDDDSDDGSAGGDDPVGIPFSCPDVFKDTASVEIDNDIFVTCDQLRPLYGADVPYKLK